MSQPGLRSLKRLLQMVGSLEMHDNGVKFAVHPRAYVVHMAHPNTKVWAVFAECLSTWST